MAVARRNAALNLNEPANIATVSGFRWKMRVDGWVPFVDHAIAFQTVSTTGSMGAASTQVRVNGGQRKRVVPGAPTDMGWVEQIEELQGFQRVPGVEVIFAVPNFEGNTFPDYWNKKGSLSWDAPGSTTWIDRNQEGSNQFEGWPQDAGFFRTDFDVEILDLGVVPIAETTALGWHRQSGSPASNITAAGSYRLLSTKIATAHNDYDFWTFIHEDFSGVGWSGAQPLQVLSQEFFHTPPFKRVYLWDARFVLRAGGESPIESWTYKDYGTPEPEGYGIRVVPWTDGYAFELANHGVARGEDVEYLHYGQEIDLTTIGGSATATITT